jgi:hypothetical protein
MCWHGNGVWCFSLAEMYWWGRFVCGYQCINDNLGVHISMGTSILICPRTCVIMWVGMIVTTVRFPWFTGKRTVSGWWWTCIKLSSVHAKNLLVFAWVIGNVYTLSDISCVIKGKINRDLRWVLRCYVEYIENRYFLRTNSFILI